MHAHPCERNDIVTSSIAQALAHCSKLFHRFEYCCTFVVQIWTVQKLISIVYMRSKSKSCEWIHWMPRPTTVANGTECICSDSMQLSTYFAHFLLTASINWNALELEVVALHCIVLCVRVDQTLHMYMHMHTDTSDDNKNWRPLIHSHSQFISYITHFVWTDFPLNFCAQSIVNMYRSMLDRRISTNVFDFFINRIGLVGQHKIPSKWII